MLTSLCPICSKMRGDDGRCEDCDTWKNVPPEPETLPEGLATKFAAEADTKVDNPRVLMDPKWIGDLQFQAERVCGFWRREHRANGKMVAAIAVLPLLQFLQDAVDRAREELTQDASRR